VQPAPGIGTRRVGGERRVEVRGAVARTAPQRLDLGLRLGGDERRTRGSISSQSWISPSSCCSSLVLRSAAVVYGPKRCSVTSST